MNKSCRVTGGGQVTFKQKIGCEYSKYSNTNIEQLSTSANERAWICPLYGISM